MSRRTRDAWASLLSSIMSGIQLCAFGGAYLQIQGSLGRSSLPRAECWLFIMMVLLESLPSPFPIRAPVTCWLASATSPNNFESIVLIVNRSLGHPVGLICGAQAARRGWDDPGDADALVTGDSCRRRATDYLLRVTIFLG